MSFGYRRDEDAILVFDNNNTAVCAIANSGNAGFGTLAPAALIHGINDVAAQIHRFTNRGPANFIVTGPEIAARFANVNTWKGAGSIAPSDAAVYKAGTLDADFAAAAPDGPRIVLSSAWNTGITLTLLGLLAAISPATAQTAHGLDTLGYFDADVVTESPAISGGRLRFPAWAESGTVRMAGLASVAAAVFMNWRRSGRRVMGISSWVVGSSPSGGGLLVHPVPHHAAPETLAAQSQPLSERTMASVEIP
jgi:hypothetical protein